MPVRKVLIVDDSRTEILHLTEILQKNGYSVLSAEGADEALALISVERPELIIMDVVMPGKNGFQLTRVISRTPQYADIPIIICTSKKLETDRLWGLRQGARDYITKPVDPDELLAKLRALG